MRSAKRYGIVIVGVFIVLGGYLLTRTIIHDRRVEFIPNTREASALTEYEERDLTRKAIVGHDPEAAHRLYEYFAFTKHDKPKADHWLKITGELREAQAKTHQ